MTVEEYRNRLMDAFHNADCDELIAVVVRPEESEFKQLEWLLKNHYHKQKQQPCEDCISRQATVRRLCKVADFMNEKREGLGSPYIMAALFIQDNKDEFPPVTPKEKTGHWIEKWDSDHLVILAYECSKCRMMMNVNTSHFCPNCGARMVSE